MVGDMLRRLGTWAGAAAKLKLNEPEILASRVPKATTLDLCLGHSKLFEAPRSVSGHSPRLLSTSINELRVWDVTALLHAEAPKLVSAQRGGDHGLLGAKR